MSDVVEMTEVSVRRGQSYLLTDVSLKISEGQHWVVLGPNGAGKTTLLDIAGGRIHPSAGTVRILGETLGRVDVFELRPRIGHTSFSMNSRIPSSEKVIDVVVTAAYGVVGRWNEEYDSTDIQRATDLLGAFGIEQLRERAFGSLSEGERKRVQIARSLMTDPELWLLDEPASGLDLGGREDLLQALHEILSDKYAPTTIMVTHHVEEIPPGATHALLLRNGKHIASGTIAEVITSDNLSTTFGLGIEVTQSAGRYFARATT